MEGRAKQTAYNKIKRKLNETIKWLKKLDAYPSKMVDIHSRGENAEKNSRQTAIVINQKEDILLISMQN